MPTPAPSFTILNAALSYSSIMLFGLIAVLAIRDGRKVLQGRLLAFLAICLAGLGLAIMPGADQMRNSAHIAARLIGLPNVGLIWWFALSLLRDDFRLDRVALMGMLALSFAPMVYFLEYFGWVPPFAGLIDTVGSVAPFFMIGHILWIALSERATDLVEPRRRARLWIVLAVMGASAVSMVAEYLGNPLHASLVRLLGTIPAQLALFFWLTELRSEQLLFVPAPNAAPSVPEISPKDISLHRKLIAAIEVEKVYLLPGLTIEALAKLLNAPTHQLRHLINVGLGFRNFAAFLGQYRIAHAKMALADVDRARDTILTISYEAGFASLQTFNRVFKDVEGVTPTDFRASALANVAQI